MFGVSPAILVGCHVTFGDIRETDAFTFPALCFGFPPLGKWVQPVMDESLGVTRLLTGFCKGYGRPGAKAHLMLLAKPLIAEGELAFGIAGAREIEVVAIADGLSEGKGFQLGVVEFGVFSGHFEFTPAHYPAHYLDCKSMS